MANGAPPEGCDLSCQTKIIINGDVAAKVLEVTCEAIERHLAAGGKLPKGQEMIVLLNKIEDDAFRLQRLFLSSIGFTGPWPHSLTIN
jgi:hypothetical protein